MGGGFAPRFAVEAAFLILLAVGAGFADLRPIVVVAVLAGGWVLVSLIEYFAWRASRQTALRVAARQEPAAWSVDEILVPEAELTTVLPAPPVEEEAEEESEAEPEPEQPRRRHLFRRGKAAE